MTLGNKIIIEKILFGKIAMDTDNWKTIHI
jgi:hypothetical protein